MSSPSPERLRAWRLFFESAVALLDVLDAELDQAVGISQRWYDVLVHLEDSPHGIPMNELADRILYSKSGFTRVVDRMDEARLVRRARPETDRRTILIVPTDTATELLERARRHHRDGIQRYFPNTSPAPTSKRSPTHAKRSAPTHDRSAPDASAANRTSVRGAFRKSRRIYVPDTFFP